MGPYLIIYGLLYVVTIAAAIGVLLNRDTVKSAMCLVGVMVSLAAHYLMLGQEFVAAIQIIVYAGAIMVLFLFVIMLLNVRERETTPWYMRNARMVAGGLCFVFFLLLVVGVQALGIVEIGEAVPRNSPSIIELSTLLTTKFMVPFLLTSVLLLVAVIGAVVMGRRADPETGEEYLVEDGL